MRRFAVRKPCVVLLAGLVWMAVTAGATEPPAEEVGPPPAAKTSGHPSLPAQRNIAGNVTQTMDVTQYTYVEIDTGDGLVWVAGPVTEVKVGDAVEVSGGIQMVDFRSSTLDRTFEKIHLVSAIRVKSQQKASSESAPAGGNAGAAPQVSGIERIEGGHTVGEIIAGRTSLAGSQIAVRGKVIKSNSAIMGRNWLHLSDGTVGPDGEREVTVSTQDTAAVGSTVVVRGTVATDRDFGSGYKYSVLIEDAKVTAD
jgi:hypothetical protein